jgi:hypothetical protein
MSEQVGEGSVEQTSESEFEALYGEWLEYLEGSGVYDD